jgi:hypothetical protein
MSKIVRNKLPYLDSRFLGGQMQGVPCFLLGNGPSIEGVDLSVLDAFFTVGINRIFYVYDPTVLLWQDLALWVQERNKVMATKAIKYVRRGADTRGGFLGFQLGGREAQITQDLRILYGRGSSGSIAYQFAHALGCNPIILVGMDCSYGSKGQTDFYGNNPMHKPHTLPNCVKGLQFIQKCSAGRQIINCSANTVWKERYTLQEAIAMLPEGSTSDRESLQKKLLGDQYATVISHMY